MNEYIAYRDLARFNLEMNGTGGNPSNSDFRLTTVDTVTVMLPVKTLQKIRCYNNLIPFVQSG